MILSERTIDLLTVCQKINKSIIIRKGSELSIASDERNIVLEADVDEKFPCDVPMYELKDFLDSIKSLRNPNIEFFDEYILFNRGVKQNKMRMSDPSVIDPPNKKIDFPDEDVRFYLFADVLKDLKKFSKINKTTYVRLESCSIANSLSLSLINKGQENNGSDLDHTFRTKVGDAVEFERPMHWSMELLDKVPIQDFNVLVSCKGVSCFESVDTYLRIYVANEPW